MKEEQRQGGGKKKKEAKANAVAVQISDSLLLVQCATGFLAFIQQIRDAAGAHSIDRRPFSRQPAGAFGPFDVTASTPHINRTRF